MRCCYVVQGVVMVRRVCMRCCYVARGVGMSPTVLACCGGSV